MCCEGQDEQQIPYGDDNQKGNDKNPDSLSPNECARLVYETHTMKLRLQRGMKHTAQPTWLRLFAIFCIGLICVGSTVQVCHEHTDSFEASLLQVRVAGPAHASVDAQKNLGTRTDSDSNSAVNCPLCVAMHSALPVADALPQTAMVALATLTRQADGIDRMFSWRFEMASRPPPAERFRA